MLVENLSPEDGISFGLSAGLAIGGLELQGGSVCSGCQERVRSNAWGYLARGLVTSCLSTNARARR